MQQRIHAQMAVEQGSLLRGILEADETNVCGKPRKENSASDREPSKRGRGARKIKVLGVAERSGSVAAQVSDRMNGKNILRFIRGFVDLAESLLISDEYAACNAVRPIMAQAVINHFPAYVVGDIHTNSIEGFWALVKRAWYGSHRHCKEQYAPLFIAESVRKYNERNSPCAFSGFLKRCFQ